MENSLNLTITHRLDPTQFSAIMTLLTEIAIGGDPAKMAALTERLKKSADALQSAISASSQS
jgi:hypothetical protein